MRRDVAHLMDGWICANDAAHAAQHLLNSKKLEVRPCSVKHAKEGECCKGPLMYHMHACAVDCSLTCADRWPRMCAGCCGIGPLSRSGVWQAFRSQGWKQTPPVHSMRHSSTSAHCDSSGTSSGAFQAFI
jgi:hypothetical protein